MYLVILSNNGDTTFFLIPKEALKKKDLNKMEQFNGDEIMGNTIYYDTREEVHKYFGYALNPDYICLDDFDAKLRKKIEKTMASEPLFKKYEQKKAFTIDPEKLDGIYNILLSYDT